MAAPKLKPAPHHEGTKHGGCCPAEKDGEMQGDCCKGMKCCDKMKPADASAAAPDAHSGHKMIH